MLQDGKSRNMERASAAGTPLPRASTAAAPAGRLHNWQAPLTHCTQFHELFCRRARRQERDRTHNGILRPSLTRRNCGLLQPAHRADRGDAGRCRPRRRCRRGRRRSRAAVWAGDGQGLHRGSTFDVRLAKDQLSWSMGAMAMGHPKPPSAQRGQRLCRHQPLGQAALPVSCVLCSPMLPTPGPDAGVLVRLSHQRKGSRQYGQGHGGQRALGVSSGSLARRVAMPPSAEEGKGASLLRCTRACAPGPTPPPTPSAHRAHACSLWQPYAVLPGGLCMPPCCSYNCCWAAAQTCS